MALIRAQHGLDGLKMADEQRFVCRSSVEVRHLLRAQGECGTSARKEEDMIEHAHEDFGGLEAPITEAVTLLPFVPARMGVDELAHFLLERGLPVVAVSNVHGELLGFVSLTELVRERFLDADIRLRSHGGPRRTTSRATARDVMMPFMLTLPRTATIQEGIHRLGLEAVTQLVVVSEVGEVVGLVSAIGILRWRAGARRRTPADEHTAEDGHGAPRRR